MKTSVIITPRVIDTINSLPSADRGPISSALTMEFILGQNPESTLTPMQNVVYSIIRFYVNQDTERSRRAMTESRTAHSLHAGALSTELPSSTHTA